MANPPLFVGGCRRRGRGEDNAGQSALGAGSGGGGTDQRNPRLTSSSSGS